MELFAVIFMYLVFVGLLAYVVYGLDRMIKKVIGRNKPRLTQTPEEAAKDESHSATRYEEPDK